jgi:transposase
MESRPSEDRYKGNWPFQLVVVGALGETMRHYLGVDWADETHAVWAVNEDGAKVTARMVRHTADALSEWGRELDQWRAQGIELWAAIERPDGPVVDFLLDHGVRVYAINPKALDRARDRFRQSGAKSDLFDAHVLAEFLRTDHGHLHALEPSSPAAQELKLLAEDCQRQIRQQTRLRNQLTATLKAYYPRPLELFEDLTTHLARNFLRTYSTPAALTALTERQWRRWAHDQHLTATRTGELWQHLSAPQIPVPAHVERAKARLMLVLVAELEPVIEAVRTYRQAVEDFFARMPGVNWARTLPGGRSGVTVPSLYARLGDAPGRWASFQHLQAHGGTVPATDRSGKHYVVKFRFACDHQLRYLADQFAFLSLSTTEWARAYYDQQRARGHTHRRALRALAAKWLKIVFVMWRRQVPYDETYHLAMIARQQMRAAA